MATNASQSHDGQLLNDLLIDRKAGTDLRSTKVLPHSSRVPVLLQLVLKRPDHIPTATTLLVTLREGNCFNLSTGTSNASVSIIPKRIGQFWDDPDPPDDLLELSKTWRDLNPDHAYVLFNNATAQTYLTAHFPPAVGIAYRRCCDATTKADLFRLAFLSLEGGIWADMDDRCIVPLTSIIPNQAEALFWQESTGHLCNNFMAAKPGHPILQQAFVTAVNAINRGDRDKVWMLTGPGLLSRAFAVAMAQAGDQWRDWLDRIVVLDEFEIWSLVAIHCRTSHKRLGKHWLKLAFPQTGQRPAMAATQHLIQT
jgi:mannosyltransferase OCH1-like enzyme